MLIWGILVYVHIYIKNHNSLVTAIICKLGIKRRDIQESILFRMKIIKNLYEGHSLC